MQDNPIRTLKIILAACPLSLFLGYLFFQNKINNQDLLLLAIILIVSFVLIVRYFQRKLALLDRKTTFQIHDNQATKDSQLLLMNIMEKLSDPLLILDSNNKILMANKSAHKILGDLILRQKISVFIRDSNLDAAIQRAYDTGNPETCEFKYGKPVSKDYLTRIHLFNLENDNHDESSLKSASKRYMLLALYDISALKHTDKMRADFVANASHELRTPLASILGFVETLQGPAGEDDPTRERFLKIIFDEASRMYRLIEDLLSLSRIERAVHIPPSDKINLCPIIESVINALEPQAKSKEMIITFSYESKCEIIGDHDQLTQVFQNLIENAIKYGQEKTEIIVSAVLNSMPPVPLKTEDVVITISNEGPGILAKHLPRLMERFYRVDSARSRSLGGTGLGLAIVKHIIQRHRGKISIESDVNSVTTVTVNLPTRSPSIQTLS